MYPIVLSAVAQRTADTLSIQRRKEFDAICAHLAEFLPAFRAAHLVTPATFWGVRGYRYLDRHFPYLILFEIAEVSAGYREDVMLIHAVLPVVS